MERLQYKVWMLCKRVCWWKQKHIIRWCSSSMRWCIIIVATRSGQRFKHSDSVFRSHRRLLRTALEARQLCFLCIWDLLPVWAYWFVWPVVCNIRSARGLHGPKILGPARPGPTKLRPSPARPVEINTKIGPAQRGSVNKKPGPARPGPALQFLKNRVTGQTLDLSLGIFTSRQINEQPITFSIGLGHPYFWPTQNVNVVG